MSKHRTYTDIYYEALTRSRCDTTDPKMIKVYAAIAEAIARRQS